MGRIQHVKQLHLLDLHGSEFVHVLHIFLPKEKKAAKTHVQQKANHVTLKRYCYRGHCISELSSFCTLSSQLQIQYAATHYSVCSSIIDSMGYNPASRFGHGQAFAGGGCAHQTRNNWFLVMDPDGNGVTCEATPPSGVSYTGWQRVCACTS